MHQVWRWCHQWRHGHRSVEYGINVWSPPSTSQLHLVLATFLTCVRHHCRRTSIASGVFARVVMHLAFGQSSSISSRFSVPISWCNLNWIALLFVFFPQAKKPFFQPQSKETISTERQRNLILEPFSNSQPLPGVWQQNRPKKH